jgi:HSP20 family molecular chaperone IbpA
MKRENPKDNTVFDPPVHMTDDGRHIHISIGLPGVAEEKIRIDIEKTTFTISIAEDGMTLNKTIRIPPGVRFFNKKFSDGLLVICLVKPAP